MISRVFTWVQPHYEKRVQILTSEPPVMQPRRRPASNVALTPRQLDVLHAVRTLHKRDRLAPTRAEVAVHLGLTSETGVDVHLQRIANRGWLAIQPGTQRGLVLLREGTPLYEPQALQRSAKGEGELARDPPEATWIDCEVLWDTFGTKPDLCLRVRGNEMERAGLVDDAIVALRRTVDDEGRMTLAAGDIVAARIGEEVVLRRVHAVDATTFELRPESRSGRHRAVRVDGQTDAELIGVVIGRVLAGAG